MSNPHRPALSMGDVPRLVMELYGIRVKVVKELDSYDDRNVMVELEDKTSVLPAHIVTKNTGSDSGKFLLKVIHGEYSVRPDILELKSAVITHLTDAGYPTPCLIHTLKGHHQSVIQLKDPETGREVKHVAKLFEFLPGVRLDKVCLTRPLCHEMGKLTGWMDAILMSFPVNDYKEIDELKICWNMAELSQVRTKLDFVKDKSKIPLLEEVISEFESNILHSGQTFLKGVIHSDVNDGNALVEKVMDDAACVKGKAPCKECVGDNNYRVSSMIDFGDLTYSFYIFELAIAMCYLMLSKDIEEPMDSGASVFAGYLEHMSLPESELIHLRTCVCARLTQSFVYGQVALATDESNAEYTQTHAARCMPVIELLWKYSDKEFLDELMARK